MERHRVLVAFGIAWVSALLLSWWLYRQITAPKTARDVVQAVAAGRDLPIGKLIQANDLKLISLERKDLPKGAFLKVADVVNRAVVVALVTNETVLEAKLAAKGGGEGLTALIEPGLRAVSVQVNDVTGVSGFIQPGTHVDVLFTRSFSNGDAATTTILQNLRVIAYGRRINSAAMPEPAAGARPAPQVDSSRPTVATLLVTQDQAELLVLAQQRGRIQLVLRNVLDEQILERTEPVHAADLGIEEPVKAKPAPPVPASVQVRPIPKEPVAEKAIKRPEGVVVKIHRAEKTSEEKFP